MVPQEPLLCRQLFCFITIIIVLPTQGAQLNPLTPLQCETHTGPYPAPRFSVLPLFYMQHEVLTRFGHGTPHLELLVPPRMPLHASSQPAMAYGALLTQHG